MTAGTALTIGWRNIWRNKRRTILTLLAIAFASAVLVFFISLQLSSYDSSINASVGVFHSHMQVQAEGYLDKPQMRKTLNHASKISRISQGTEGVSVVSIRAVGFALVSSEERSYGCQIIGVQPDREPLLSSIPGVVRRGAYLSGEAANEAVIGSGLAKNLKVKIGDELTLLGQGRDGSLAAAVVPVAGIFESGSADMDRSMIQLPLETFREIFSMGDEAHSIVVKATRLDDIAMIQKRLAEKLAVYPKAVVLSWEELLPGLKQSIELDMASGWLFYLSLIIVVTFSILNTFLMSVLERTKEFGVMLALGTKPWSISGLILLECSVLTLIGNLFGIVIGGAVVMYFWQNGFYIPGSEEIMKQWNLPAVIYPRLSFVAASFGPAVLFVVALVSALYPALRVLRLRPTEAMRHV